MRWTRSIWFLSRLILVRMRRRSVFYLGFAGAAGADAAAESFEVGPLADEAGEEVLVLGEFDLPAGLRGCGRGGRRCGG